MKTILVESSDRILIFDLCAAAPDAGASSCVIGASPRCVQLIELGGHYHSRIVHVVQSRGAFSAGT